MGYVGLRAKAGDGEGVREYLNRVTRPVASGIAKGIAVTAASFTKRRRSSRM
jgi:hypothetical protein